MKKLAFFDQKHGKPVWKNAIFQTAKFFVFIAKIFFFFPAKSY